MRRLLPLGIAVTALIALAGVASHGRPLEGGRGSGPTATFFDYLATTLVIYAVIMLAVLVWILFAERKSGAPLPPRRGYVLSSIISFIGAVVIALLISRHHFLERLRGLNVQANKGQHAQTLPKPPPAGKNVRNPHLRWDEIAIVLALLGGAGVLLYATRNTRRPARPWVLGREAAVFAALDESIDDLRNDPDLRRAIIAAYARMEQALARVGLPRHPAEAPFEYVERALRSLDTSSESARRLTDLFEWAKFSHHEPEPEMRDEAIDALVAVRDELRGTVTA